MSDEAPGTRDTMPCKASAKSKKDRKTQRKSKPSLHSTNSIVVCEPPNQYHHVSNIQVVEVQLRDRRCSMHSVVYSCSRNVVETRRET